VAAERLLGTAQADVATGVTDAGMIALDAYRGHARLGANAVVGTSMPLPRALAVSAVSRCTDGCPHSEPGRGCPSRRQRAERRSPAPTPWTCRQGPRGRRLGEQIVHPWHFLRCERPRRTTGRVWVAERGVGPTRPGALVDDSCPACGSGSTVEPRRLIIRIRRRRAGGSSARSPRRSSLATESSRTCSSTSGARGGCRRRVAQRRARCWRHCGWSVASTPS
jgi:hypothetical protein